MLLISYIAPAQNKTGVGVSAVINANNFNTGIGIRAMIPVRSKLYATPYFNYFPAGAGTAGGLTAHYYAIDWNGFAVYGLVSGSFGVQVSASVSDSAYSGNKSSNASGEAGICLMYGKRCIKPFLEPRYDFVNKTTWLHFGFMYYFLECGKKSGKGNSYGKRSRKSGIENRGFCPAYY